MLRPVVYFATLCLAAPAAVSAPFTAEHLVRIDRVGAPVVSPAGDRVVYAVRHADIEADKGRYDLWLSDLDGGTPEKIVAQGSVSAFDDAGGNIVFTSNSLASPAELHVLNRGSGDSQQITAFGARTLRLSRR